MDGDWEAVTSGKQVSVRGVRLEDNPSKKPDHSRWRDTRPSCGVGRFANSIEVATTDATMRNRWGQGRTDQGSVSGEEAAGAIGVLDHRGLHIAAGGLPMLLPARSLCDGDRSSQGLPRRLRLVVSSSARHFPCRQARLVRANQFPSRAMPMRLRTGMEAVRPDLAVSAAVSLSVSGELVSRAKPVRRCCQPEQDRGADDGRIPTAKPAAAGADSRRMTQDSEIV